MFKDYTNKKANETEMKTLNSKHNDCNWYNRIVKDLFNDYRNFEIRPDIEIPNDEDGVVLIFEENEFAYLKSITDNLDDSDMTSILNVCSILKEKLKCEITPYIIMPEI